MQGATSQLFVLFTAHAGVGWAEGGLVVRHQDGWVALRQPIFFAFSHSKSAHQDRLCQLAVSGVVPCPPERTRESDVLACLRAVRFFLCPSSPRGLAKKLLRAKKPVFMPGLGGNHPLG